MAAPKPLVPYVETSPPRPGNPNQPTATLDENQPAASLAQALADARKQVDKAR